MKKVCIIICFLMLVTLTSCAYLTAPISQDNNVIADNTFKRLIAAIESKDVSALKELFSKNVQAEATMLDKDLAELLELFQGDILSFSSAKEAGVHSSKVKEHGRVRMEIQPSFRITTSNGIYFVALKQCIADTFDENNVGIISVYIINSADWSYEYIYRGDGTWQPGINLVDQR